MIQLKLESFKTICSAASDSSRIPMTSLQLYLQKFTSDFGILGCSDYDQEYMYALDGEEKWYADYKRETGVGPQLPLGGHFVNPDGYQFAKVYEQVCRRNLKALKENTKGLPLEQDPPSNVMVYSRDEVELGLQNTLICHVSGFYPAPVNVSWTRNGEKVPGSINIPLPSSDGTFTQISRLQFVPQLGDIYSCSVEHPALPEVQTKIWDVEKSQPGVGPALFCGLGLVVGLLGVATGTFFLIKGNECS
uniref:Ig-like domain-containing protein n=1 Tax=Oryzias sinensis TaxID=183150 RepID=A0A8C7X169_9TELE